MDDRLLMPRAVDLKYDNCNVPANWTDKYQYWPEYWYGTHEDQVGGTPAPAGYDWSRSNTTTRYNNMRDALVRQSRTIFFSLCNWGHSHVEQWGSETGQSWRMWGDIVPVWSGKDDYSWGFSKWFLFLFFSFLGGDGVCIVWICTDFLKCPSSTMACSSSSTVTSSATTISTCWKSEMAI